VSHNGSGATDLAILMPAFRHSIQILHGFAAAAAITSKVLRVPVSSASLLLPERMNKSSLPLPTVNFQYLCKRILSHFFPIRCIGYGTSNGLTTPSRSPGKDPDPREDSKDPNPRNPDVLQ
jgi:hypothetical protein